MVAGIHKPQLEKNHLVRLQLAIDPGTQPRNLGLSPSLPPLAIMIYHPIQLLPSFPGG